MKKMLLAILILLTAFSATLEAGKPVHIVFASVCLDYVSLERKPDGSTLMTFRAGTQFETVTLKKDQHYLISWTKESD